MECNRAAAEEDKSLVIFLFAKRTCCQRSLSPQDGPEHAADPGVDEDGGDQHQAGGGSSGDGAGDAGVSAGWKGWTSLARVVFYFTLDIPPSQVTSESLGQIKMADNNGGYDEDPLPISYDDEDYNEEMMEVQPDIILEGQDQEPEQFDSIVEEEGVDPIQS